MSQSSPERANGDEFTPDGDPRNIPIDTDPQWEPSPLLAGDHADDDGQVIDDMFEANGNPPPHVATSKVTPQDIQLDQLEKRRSTRIISGSKPIPTSSDTPILIVPADPERVSVIIVTYAGTANPSARVRLGDAADTARFAGRIPYGVTWVPADHTGAIWAYCNCDTTVDIDYWVFAK